MSTPIKERRSEPRRDDASIRFSWAGARTSEPVANFSSSGAKLMTVRSAPVGALVEFELQHADGTTLNLVGTVRRVERATRKADGDGRLSLSVEYQDVDEQVRVVLEQWNRATTSSRAGSGSSGGTATAGEAETQHEGQLWESEAVSTSPQKSQPASGASPAFSDLFAPEQLTPSAPESNARRAPREALRNAARSTGFRSELDDTPTFEDQGSASADQEQLIGELQHRLAQAETQAAEALEKLASAEERLQHLGVFEQKNESVGATEAIIDMEAAPQASLSDVAAPIMVDALLESGEIEPEDLNDSGVRGEDDAGQGDADEPSEVDGPISSAVRTLAGVSFSPQQAAPDPADDEQAAPAELSESKAAEAEVPVLEEAEPKRAEASAEELFESFTPQVPMSEGASDGPSLEDHDAATEAVPSLPDEDDLATRAFSQDLVATARQAAADLEVGAGVANAVPPEGETPDSDEEDPLPTEADDDASGLEETGPDSGGFAEAIPRTGDSDQAWPELDLEPSEAMTVQFESAPSKVAQSPDLSDSAAFSLDPKTDLPSLAEEDASLSVAQISNAPASELAVEEMDVEPLPMVRVAPPPDEFEHVEEIPVTGAAPAEEGFSEPAAAFDSSVEPTSSPLTFREIPSREGMIAAMATGSIVRTERFGRLEPVSRADIQVSDLLMETSALNGLEEMSNGVLDREQLHKVLFVFFQRGLIEIQP